ncbi:MAG: ABC transporter permease, partial [Betaproteobacteria bacterium]
MKLKPIATGLTALFAFAAGSAQAQISNDTIKIGVITDMSGLYADIDGPGGVEAVKMAIADFGGTLNGKKIELVFADHQNKADIAASKAREWFDTEGVDMLISGTNSGTALAMAKVADEKKKPNFVIGAGTARITNEECNPYSIHYAYDTVAMAKGTGSAVVKQGGKSWYFLTADYAFGTSLETDTTAVVKANGGTVKGAIRHPLSASDFSSFMLQAQASGAQILGLANAGGDTVNSIKAANEFGVTGSMKLAGLLMFINDVHALGLGQTKGMYLTDSWYWDQNDETRKWSKRFFDKMKKMPSSLHAADYSATLQYLNAVKAAGTDDGAKVMEALRKQKVNDMYAKNGYYRADGSMIHDMFLMQVKDPKESKKPWDYLKVV